MTAPSQPVTTADDKTGLLDDKTQVIAPTMILPTSSSLVLALFDAVYCRYTLLFVFVSKGCTL